MNQYYFIYLFLWLGGWQNSGEVKVGAPLVLDVTDLTTKKEYKFRVKAVSKIGPSEPTPLAKTVLAKDPWGKIFHNYKYLNIFYILLYIIFIILL